MNETHELDLHDIQGNIVKAYSRFGFPKGRYFFFRVNDGQAGRRFVRDLLPSITTSARWRKGGSTSDGSALPKVTTNVAFSFDGLWRLGVPQASLQSFPEAFAMGMKARHEILGDDGRSAPDHWDPIWQAAEAPHVFVSLCATDDGELERRYQEVLAIAREAGVELLLGHRGKGGDDLPYQEGSAIYVDGQPTAKEHFGFTDGISDPFFRGALSDSSNVIGGGKRTGLPVDQASGWEPIETGEFLLGHKDEAFEYPEAPIPRPLAENGTYLVYRKLHENVASFDRYLDHVGREYPGGKEALAAKFAGRWRNGAPLALFPTEKEADEFAEKWAAAKAEIVRSKGVEREKAKRKFSELNTKFVAFDFTNDLDGSRCPIGSHTRRVHPRSALEFECPGAFERPDSLSNRRRLIRRGLPYGDSQKERRDEDEHGVIFMALCANIRRQFEFVQQQWVNYGNDFRRANEKDPILGNHGVTASGAGDGVMVIETAEQDPNPPFLCSKLPRFVETRGGDYYFVPSLTALRMIGDGIVDPT